MEIPAWKRKLLKKQKQLIQLDTQLRAVEEKYIRRTWKIVLPDWYKPIHERILKSKYKKLHLILYYLGFRYYMEGSCDYETKRTRTIELHRFFVKMRTWQGGIK